MRPNALVALAGHRSRPRRPRNGGVRRLLRHLLRHSRPGHRGPPRARLGGAGVASAGALFLHFHCVAARLPRSVVEVDGARRTGQGRRFARRRYRHAARGHSGGRRGAGRAAPHRVVGTQSGRDDDRARRAVQGRRRRSLDDFPQTRKRALMTGGLAALLILTFLVLVIVAKTAVVVPQQSAFVVERLGRFHGILNAGFHVLLPFVDVIRYRHSLKEIAVDIPAQVCITRDNVQVGVDGVLYLKVLNPERASYGISDYMFAISQLAQTTLRSEVGKIDLDRTFEERTNINTAVVSELDKASEAWGVKVLRYEIKNITPPADILAAMEKQMRAEREKRAVILTSEGTRDAAINTAEGVKQEVIKASEARKQQQINEAEGQAAAILAVATATAGGLRSVAEALRSDGGMEAVQLRVAEQYIAQFGQLAKSSNTLVLPANAADVGSMIALAMKSMQSIGTIDPNAPPAQPPRRT